MPDALRELIVESLPITMKQPEQDIDDRKVIWDLMQDFWMDTDPEILLPRIAEACAASKYSLAELEVIYWNEVRPAVSFNFLLFPAPEWAGFEVEWLTIQILKKHRFGKRLPVKWLHPYSYDWWRKLVTAISEHRMR